MKRLFGYSSMSPYNFQLHLYNRSKLKLEMYDAFSIVREYGKSSAKFLLGTTKVIERVELLWHFLFLAQTTIRIRLDF